MAKGMAGTRAAYVTCSSCGHARIRHMGRGQGKCSQTVTAIDPDHPGGWVKITCCTCEHFTDREEQ